MGWGVFSALRYLGHTNRGARTVMPDGRPLRRPMGAWSESVRTQVRTQRRARRQPRWPRVLGWTFMSMALFAAVGAEYPMPRPVQAGISVEAASCLLAIETVLPAGPHEGVPPAFTWVADAPPPYVLVVLDAGYRELARIERLTGCSMKPDPELAWLLGTGGAFHWYVQGEGPRGTVRSPMEAIEIR